MLPLFVVMGRMRTGPVSWMYISQVRLTELAVLNMDLNHRRVREGERKGRDK